MRMPLCVCFRIEKLTFALHTSGNEKLSQLIEAAQLPEDLLRPLQDRQRRSLAGSASAFCTHPQPSRHRRTRRNGLFRASANEHKDHKD